MKIGDIVKQLREARGWTQGELARRVGNIEQNTISAIETGRTLMPEQATLLGLADAFGISEIELLRAAGYVRANPEPTVIPPELHAIYQDLQSLPTEKQAIRLRALSQIARVLRDADPHED